MTAQLRNTAAARPPRGGIGTTLLKLVWAMSKVISMSEGNDAVWRRRLGFVLDGLRAA